MSLVTSKAPLRRTKTTTASRDFRIGMKCAEHDLLIHSFTVKPFSMVCDRCIQEISNYKLQIKPFPQVVERARADLKKANEILQKKKDTYYGIKLENPEAKSQGLIQQLEEHFQSLKLNLAQTALSSKTQLLSLISAHDQDKKFVVDMVKSEVESAEKMTEILHGLMEKK